MILVNKQEAFAIREKFPEIQLVRTMRQKSKRGRYYVEEASRVVRFVNKLRGIEEPVSTNRNKKGGGRHTTGKKKW